MRMMLKLKTRAVECENECNESFDASDKDAAWFICYILRHLVGLLCSYACGLGNTF